MRIKLNRSIGKVESTIFSLCQFNISHMTWLFIGIFLAEQGLSVSIEMMIYGEHFSHWFDYVFLMVLTTSYFYYTNELGKFLLDLILNAEVIEK